MRTSYALLLAAGLSLVGCGQGDKSPTPPPPAAPAKETKTESGGSVVTAPVDYLASAAKAKKTADGAIDTAALNQQVQLFYAQEGRFPKDLDELVTSKYMKSLPTPPFGTKLEYNAANGTVKVVKQ